VQKLLELKRRMATIRNIQTVTRTLATVSSAKLSRSRGRASGMRLYADRMRLALQRQQGYLSSRGEDLAGLSPYLAPHRKISDILLLHISSDRGMCGSYNLAVNRRALKFVQHQKDAGRKVTAMCKGLKGERYVRRRGLAPVSYAEAWSRAGVQDEDVDRFFHMVTEPFLAGEVQEVYATFTQFYTPIHRQPRAIRLLPVHNGSLHGTMPTEQWSYEPGFGDVLSELIEMFVRCQIEEVLLQSYASEQGARMITMEEATERAAVALHDCQILHNRLRREAITTDLIGVLFAAQLRQEEAAAEEGA
jgi:F-type H+-transporting ATPase subunit gamma